MNPIAKTTSVGLSKPSSKQTPLENLSRIFREIKTIADAVRRRESPAEKHMANRDALKRMLADTGLDIKSLDMMETLAKQPAARRLSDKIRKKSDVDLTRELLALLANLPAIRSNSHTYGEAWPAVEGEYCLKISLYRVEKETRAASSVAQAH